MYCEKCRHVIDSDRCPVCKSRKVRMSQPSDICFLTEQDYVSSEILEGLLRRNRIPFLKKDVMGAGLAMKVGPMLERTRFYVPFSRFSGAASLVSDLLMTSQA